MYDVNETDGMITIALILSKQSSMNFSVQVMNNDITATGEQVFVIINAMNH